MGAHANDHNHNDEFTRPNVVGCLVGVILGAVVILGAYLVVYLLVPGLRAIAALPTLVLLLVVAVAG